MTSRYREQVEQGLARPWCFPCRTSLGDRNSAAMGPGLGVACDFHWEMLSRRDQESLRAAVLARHPRGGRVVTVNEQVWIVRHDLRHNSAGQSNTVEATWIGWGERFWAEIETDSEIEA
jgi:hypothetical protein